MSRKNHLLRLNMPNTWPIGRKLSKWITKPIPGAHSIKNSLPLVVILRDVLGYARNAKEAKNMINNKNILVNKKTKLNYRSPVGLFDVIEIPKLDERYIVLFNQKGKISLFPLKKEEAKGKLCKIKGKKLIKGGKIQLNFLDGRNIITNNKEYKVGDSLYIDPENNKVISHLPLKKDAIVYLIGGSHVGNIGKVKEIISKKDLQKKKIVYEREGEIRQTLREYIFVIGDNKPLINIGK